MKPRAPSSLSTDAIVNLTDQAGSSFSGRVINTTIFMGFSFEEEMDLDGTVSGNGSLAGSYEERLFVEGFLESDVDGTFSGTFSGDQIVFEFSGEDTFGDTCRISDTTQLER